MIRFTRRYRNIRRIAFILDSFVMITFLFFHQSDFIGGNILLWPEVLFVIFIMFICIYSFRAFHLARHEDWRFLLTSILTGWFTGVITATFFLMIFNVRISRNSFILLSLTLLSCVLAVHFVLYFLLTRFTETERVIVIGREETFSKMMNDIAKATGEKIRVLKYFVPEENHICEGLQQFPETETVIIADRGPIDNPDIHNLLSGLIDKDINVRFLPSVAEKTLSRVPLGLAHIYRRFYDILLITVEPETYQRAFDLLVSTVAMVALLPLYAIISILIALDSGFPVIFKQQRVGLFEKPFTLYKFRTMSPASPDAGPAFLEENGEERITRVGRFLRKTRLDEIPQLWNVFVGEMSIIGPRPEMDEFYQEGKKKIPFYRYRTRLRPGITGWAQVNFSHTTDLEDYKKKTEYDLYYIKNRSLLLDLQIVLLTAEVMLGLKGSR